MVCHFLICLQTYFYRLSKQSGVHAGTAILLLLLLLSFIIFAKKKTPQFWTADKGSNLEIVMPESLLVYRAFLPSGHCKVCCPLSCFIILLNNETFTFALSLGSLTVGIQLSQRITMSCHICAWGFEDFWCDVLCYVK